MSPPMGKKRKISTPIDIDFTLRRVFNKKGFRPLQREITIAAIEGHDVFLQAATSFGKSLCFQLPAVISRGIRRSPINYASLAYLSTVTVVVSPLLALMNNQLAALQSAGIAVATINSQTPMEKRNEIQTDLLCGHPYTRLLYVTPELCLTDSFRKTLSRIHQQGQLERIAIDEAHCISEWGHDFRTAYKELSWFKRCLILPSVPIMALTATATPRVQSDIISSLGLDASSLKLYAMSTARPNIHYEIRYTNDSKDPFPSLVTYLHECHARRAERLALPNPPSSPPLQISGIIYVRLRTTTESLATKLRTHGIGAAPFHAGLPASVRDATQTSWLKNEPGFAIIVATTAFGMGIDKDDVRFVVHWDLPKSFEGFYQEAGRAGRDGNAALSIVYYSREERERSLYRLANDNFGPRNGNFNPTAASIAQSKKGQRLASFNALVSYCESTTRCRHELIKKYFGGETSPATAMTALMPVAENTQGAEPECDYACDFCKSDFERTGVKLAKERGLASEEEAFAASQWGNQAEIEAGKWGD